MIFQLDEGCAQKKIYFKGCGVILLCGGGGSLGPTRFSLHHGKSLLPQRPAPKGISQKLIKK